MIAMSPSVNGSIGGSVSAIAKRHVAGLTEHPPFCAFEPAVQVDPKSEQLNAPELLSVAAAPATSSPPLSRSIVSWHCEPTGQARLCSTMRGALSHVGTIPATAAFADRARTVPRTIRIRLV